MINKHFIFTTLPSNALDIIKVMWCVHTIIPLDYFIISNQNIWHKLFYSIMHVLHFFLSAINFDFAILYYNVPLLLP